MMVENRGVIWGARYPMGRNLSDPVPVPVPVTVVEGRSEGEDGGVVGSEC